MLCQECNQTVVQLDNCHLAGCCGLTLQEYAIRHHIPLDGLLHADQLNRTDSVGRYTRRTDTPNDYDRSVFNGLLLAQAIHRDGEFVTVEGEIRRLDELLWYQKSLQAWGFQFRQEYCYNQDTQRVVARNRLKVPAEFIDLPIEDLCIDTVSLATLVARAGEYRGGYVFMQMPRNSQTDNLLTWLAQNHQIRMVKLASIDASDNDQMIRTESLADAVRLLDVIKEVLMRIPCVSDRYFAPVDEAIVSKEMVFDAAHFITDHPGKCVNLHGGRYTMNVKVRGRIDPLSGFVIDYGFLKKVVKKQVIELLDHHALNYTATDLAWRSSTELLSIYIWERLIQYLPDLYELQIYETTQSFCVYRGASLEQLQLQGGETALKHFSQPGLGRSALRSLMDHSPQAVIQAQVKQK